MFALNPIFDPLGVDCRHLNLNSYGSVDVGAGAGTATLTSRDATGAAVIGQVPALPCTRTLDP